MSQPVFPAWLDELRAAPALTGIHWLTADEIAAATFDDAADEHLGMYGEIFCYTDADLRGDAAGRLARSVRVGVGEEGGRFSALARSFGAVLDYPAEFWFDPAAPSALWCSLNVNCPPHLWFPVGTTAESVAAGTAVYFNGRPADPAETALQYMQRVKQRSRGRDVPDDWVTSRFLLGVVGDMGGEENRFVGRAAFCRYFDAMGTTAGDDRLVPETVFHTLQSFTRVRLEFHTWLQYDDGQGGAASPVVAEVAHPVCAHGGLIRAYNGVTDSDVPVDFPVDALAALFGYPIKGLPRMYRALSESVEPGDITYNLGLIVATEGHDPTLVACLREYAAHPAPRVRDRVGRFANMVGHPELTREILAAEQDDGVREALRNLLGPQV